jgi:hypothetical protein
MAMKVTYIHGIEALEGIRSSSHFQAQLASHGLTFTAFIPLSSLSSLPCLMLSISRRGIVVLMNFVSYTLLVLKQLKILLL